MNTPFHTPPEYTDPCYDISRELLDRRCRIVYELEEERIRQQLIALGWTPPGTDLLRLAEMVRDACYAAEIGMGVGPDVNLPAIIEQFKKGA